MSSDLTDARHSERASRDFLVLYGEALIHSHRFDKTTLVNLHVALEHIPKAQPIARDPWTARLYVHLSFLYRELRIDPEAQAQ